jgi:hypothetical protein
MNISLIVEMRFSVIFLSRVGIGVAYGQFNLQNLRPWSLVGFTISVARNGSGSDGCSGNTWFGGVFNQYHR